jgi:hypothetical protein
VQITAPQAGASHAPGDLVIITVEATGGLTEVLVIGEGSVGLSALAQGTSPFQLSMTLPAELSPGSYGLVAVGLPASGPPVYSPAVRIAVELTVSPSSILTAPRSVNLAYLGATANVHVSGLLANGTSATLNGSSQIRFVSSNPLVASVDASGTVTGVGAGTASLTVNYASQTATVPITVTAGSSPAICTFTVTGVPGSVAGSAGAASATVTVTDASCNWVAFSSAPWITFGNNARGIGSSTLPILFAANSSPSPLSATVTIASQLFPILQAAGPPFSACDVNQDTNTNVVDVQNLINEALGVVAAVHDLNHDGAINVADVGIVINSALGLGCPY